MKFKVYVSKNSLVVRFETPNKEGEFRYDFEGLGKISGLHALMEKVF
jgi:hypothetical protein